MESKHHDRSLCPLRWVQGPAWVASKVWLFWLHFPQTFENHCKTHLKTTLDTLVDSHPHNPATAHKVEAETDYLLCDIHSVCKKFDLEPKIQTHATCVRDSSTYLPIVKKKMTVYPKWCTFTKYWSSKPCSQLLVKTVKSGGTQIAILIRPFIVQDYNNFLVSLLSRSGMEVAMECGTRLNNKF